MLNGNRIQINRMIEYRIHNVTFVNATVICG